MLITQWINPNETIPTMDGGSRVDMKGRHWLDRELERLLPSAPNAFIATKDDRGSMYIALDNGK